MSDPSNQSELSIKSSQSKRLLDRFLAVGFAENNFSKSVNSETDLRKARVQI